MWKNRLQSTHPFSPSDFLTDLLICFLCKITKIKKATEIGKEKEGGAWRGQNDGHQKHLQFSLFFWTKMKNTRLGAFLSQRKQLQLSKHSQEKRDLDGNSSPFRYSRELMFTITCALLFRLTMKSQQRPLHPQLRWLQFPCFTGLFCKHLSDFPDSINTWIGHLLKMGKLLLSFPFGFLILL